MIRPNRTYTIAPADDTDPDASKWAGRKVTTLRQATVLTGREYWRVEDEETGEKRVFRAQDLKEA